MSSSTINCGLRTDHISLQKKIYKACIILHAITDRTDILHHNKTRNKNEVKPKDCKFGDEQLQSIFVMSGMDNQSGSNIDDIHDERIETERFSGFSGDDNDGEYNFEDIGLSDDEELIPGSNSSTLEECAKENGEEDNFYNSDKEVDDENEHSVETEVEAPKDGMKFDTVEDLLKHLTDYAKQCAFSVRLRNVKQARNTNKLAKHILWICHKGRQQSSRSKNKMKPRPSQMTNCGANFNAKEFEGQWMYTSVNLDHNHPLKLEDIRYLRAYRKVPKEVERRIMINDEAGIRPSKTYLAEAVKRHGFQNLPFLERDMRNLLQKKRQEKLAGPDSVALYNYFMKSMKESNNFFFAMDLECDGRIRNVMWVDSRSRAAYKDFSDSVGLDSTYLKNKYEMPFAPFIGINHHGQTILLGCALLSSEDIETYRWLLRTWVDCMGGVAPKAIITDQSVPITKAIKLEMPNTRHRWCLWHIMEKQNKKFKSYKYFHEIKGAMSRCVYDSMSVDEFEASWKEFVDLYELKNNAWLYTLYKDRHRWVPTFLTDCFWAGMSTTQRNESVNAFFKGYVNSKTSLKEFVLKYDLALGAKCDKEILAEHQSRNTRYQIVTKFAAERFFQPVYTHYAFQKVMDEVRGCMYTTPSIHTDEEDFREFKVEDTREFGDLPIEKRVEYTVKLQKGTNEVYCSCKLFETRGIMCRHSLKILYDAGVQKIPNFYIVNRWRKDIDRPYMRVKVPYYDPVKSECVMRYQKMQEEFEKLAIKAMNSAGDFDTVLTGIMTISQNLTTQNDFANEGRMSSEQVSQNEDRRGIIFFMDNSDGSQTKVALQDLNQVKAVGRPRITVRQKQTGVSRKKKSQRTNLQNKTSQDCTGVALPRNFPGLENIPKKRKNRNTGTAQDEMASDEDDLFLRPSASVANCGPTTHLSDDIHHPGEYTRMLQYFEQRGQSNNLVNEKLSRSNMEQQS